MTAPTGGRPFPEPPPPAANARETRMPSVVEGQEPPPSMKNDYLERYGADPRWKPFPEIREGFRTVVVIPALAESSSILHTLQSLAANPEGDLAGTLVLVVVNNRERAFLKPGEWEDNRKTLEILRELASGRDGGGATRPAAREVAGRVRLTVVDASSPGLELPEKTGGVGLARKIGFDCALRLPPPRGGGGVLLCSLDADTLVEPNYLSSVRRFFKDGKRGAAAIRFRHPRPVDEEEQKAIVCYEIFLRYYVLGLRSARSPYAFHAVGSAMACTSGAYAAVRGMNRRKGGEDFYFLNKLAKVTAVGDIRSTTVHPSPRRSGRVPFGTGRRVLRFLEEERDEYLLYHPRVFSILESWLETVSWHPGEKGAALLERAKDIHPALATFLETRGFAAAWENIRKNAKRNDRLLRQFHGWFDGFETLKLVRFLSEEAFPLVPMFEALPFLFRRWGVPCPAGLPSSSIPPAAVQEEILFAMESMETRPPSPGPVDGIG